MPASDPLQLTVSIPELPELIQDVRNLDDLVLDEAAITMRRAVDVVENAVALRTPVNTGALRQSIGAKVQRGVSMVRGEVASPLEYALPVERGRAPGKWPPRSAIEFWVQRKLGISDPAEIRTVAFLIARKIGREGTRPGARMFEEGFSAVRPIVESDLQGVAGRVAARFEQS